MNIQEVTMLDGDEANRLWLAVGLAVAEEWGDTFEFCDQGHLECAVEPDGRCYEQEVDKRITELLKKVGL